MITGKIICEDGSEASIAWPLETPIMYLMNFIGTTLHVAAVEIVKVEHDLRLDTGYSRSDSSDHFLSS